MNQKITALLSLIVFLTLGNATKASVPPVAKLVEPQGNVEYRRGTSDWKVVKRTKYLFEGYAVRTGEDGSVRLISQINGDSRQLRGGSQIQVSGSDIKLISGELSDSISGDASFYQSLNNKFAKAQRYTTVRRSAGIGETDSCDSKVRTIRKISISNAYPDLVWRNACPEYSYRLVIDNGSPIEVSAQSTSEMIRYNVSQATPGEHTFRVEVMDNDGIIYIPKRDSVFSVLTAEQEEVVLSELEQIEGDVILGANVLEQNGLFVAMMDIFREHFAENPDDNGLRPLLIQAYQDLKLSNLREREARLYNASLNEDS